MLQSSLIARSTKDGAQRPINFRHFSHFLILVINIANFLGGAGIQRFIRNSKFKNKAGGF
jgi:hypothetical protein